MGKVQIRSVDVLSLAKVYGILMAAMGVLVGLIYGVVLLVMGAVMTGGGEQEGMGLVVIGAIAVCGAPVAYGVLGFVSGLITGLVYNVIAGKFGGIELELESVQAP